MPNARSLKKTAPPAFRIYVDAMRWGAVVVHVTRLGMVPVMDERWFLRLFVHRSHISVIQQWMVGSGSSTHAFSILL